VRRRYLRYVLPLAFLAPNIVEAIATSRQPAELTAETLIKRTLLPLEWAAQKRLLGIA
jgi:site-specific DNA recombinase